jgi:hypothetical protein
MRVVLASLLLVAAPWQSTVRAQETRVDLRIGVTDGADEYLFHNVRGVGTLANGEIAVLNSGTSEVRIFSPTGQFLRAFGREGDGPGEFRTPLLFAVVNDEIMVQDPERIQFFDPQGHVIRSFQAFRADRTYIEVSGHIGTGWVARRRITTIPAEIEPGQFYADTISLQTIDSAGTRLTELIRYPARREVGLPVGTPGTRKYYPLFEGAHFAATSSDGRAFVTDREDYRIRVLDEHGQLIRTISREHTPRRITQADLDRYRELAQPGGRDRPRSAVIENAADGRLAAPRPEVLPALGQILAAPDGSFWVERPDLSPDPGAEEYIRTFGYGIPEPATTWDRFDATGNFVAQVRLPGGFRPHSVTANTVLGVQVGEDDVQRVVRLRVVN